MPWVFNDVRLISCRSPSGGLLDSPDEAWFYDWILIDSKESPFVSFHFLYRSLLNLRQLSLAPDPTELDDSSVDMEEDMVEHTSKGFYSIKPLRIGNPRTESPSSSVLDDALSVEEEPRSSTRPRRLTEAAPIIAPPNTSARPLPEVPVKKPVDHGDIENQVQAHEYTSLSDIQEEVEHTDTSITTSTTSFPDRIDSPRTIKARVLELNDCGIMPLQPALRRDTSSTILESLVNYSEHSELAQNRALFTSMGYLETDQPEQTSEMKSIVAEAEYSFRTGWRLSESEWIKGRFEGPDMNDVKGGRTQVGE
jgi:hypothetical protein